MAILLDLLSVDREEFKQQSISFPRL